MPKKKKKTTRQALGKSIKQTSSDITRKRMKQIITSYSNQYLIPNWITLSQVATAHGKNIQSGIQFPSVQIPGTEI